MFLERGEGDGGWKRWSGRAGEDGSEEERRREGGLSEEAQTTTTEKSESRELVRKREVKNTTHTGLGGELNLTSPSRDSSPLPPKLPDFLSSLSEASVEPLSPVRGSSKIPSSASFVGVGSSGVVSTGSGRGGASASI